ncbi:DNA topoisomerase IB [soil metagenome]
MFKDEPALIDTEPEAWAEAASLLYISDSSPGFSRVRTATRFRYLDKTGQKLTDEKTIDRIRSLVIPPAWEDVWIAPSAKAHIQATGRDARGRKQYRYHTLWTAARGEAKYSSLIAFARALPEMRARIDSDLRRHGMPRQKVLATIVWLLDNALIRVGNTAYAKANKSFGLTTLKSRHVEIEGSTLRFAFRGKSGKEWNLKIRDRRIGRIVREIQDIPGQDLFQYLDEEGARHSIGSHDVNEYIRETSRSEFSSKHFRTWGGTVTAAGLLAETPVPGTKREMKFVVNDIIDKVASQLGNTRAVCRACYIHPSVITAWSEGRLTDEFAAIESRFRKPIDRLDEDETLVLRWLENTDAPAAQ